MQADLTFQKSGEGGVYYIPPGVCFTHIKILTYRKMLACCCWWPLQSCGCARVGEWNSRPATKKGVRSAYRHPFSVRFHMETSSLGIL